MKIRIALWAFAGLLVAAGWSLYVWATAPVPITTKPILWSLAQLSCPAVLMGTRLHFGVSIYLVFLSNVVGYGLIGLLVEMLRRALHPSGSSTALC